MEGLLAAVASLRGVLTNLDTVCNEQNLYVKRQLWPWSVMYSWAAGALRLTSSDRVLRLLRRYIKPWLPIAEYSFRPDTLIHGYTRGIIVVVVYRRCSLLL